MGCGPSSVALARSSDTFSLVYPREWALRCSAGRKRPFNEHAVPVWLPQTTPNFRTAVSVGGASVPEGKLKRTVCFCILDGCQCDVLRHALAVHEPSLVVVDKQPLDKHPRHLRVQPGKPTMPLISNVGKNLGVLQPMTQKYSYSWISGAVSEFPYRGNTWSTHGPGALPVATMSCTRTPQLVTSLSKL
jgi:hypothetical protein